MWASERSDGISYVSDLGEQSRRGAQLMPRALWVVRCSAVVCLLFCLAVSSAGAQVIRDGPRLAVAKNTLFPFRYSLETIDVTGAQALRLAGGGPKERPLPEFASPSWSPDGAMI